MCKLYETTSGFLRFKEVIIDLAVNVAEIESWQASTIPKY